MSAGRPYNYRAEVVGSLLRPEYLKQAFDALRARRDRRRRADRSSRIEPALEAIALQEECGIDVLTDGEVRRRFWFDPLTASLSGYNSRRLRAGAVQRRAGQAAEPPPKLPAVTETARHPPQPAAPGVRASPATHAHGPVKTTIAGHDLRQRPVGARHLDGAYPDRDAYLADALRLMTEVVGEVVAAGSTYVQLDSPRYTHLVSEEGQANLRRVGLDTETWLGEMIALDNALIRAFPEVDLRRPPVPRQPPQHVVGRGRLRRHRRAAVQRP